MNTQLSDRQITDYSREGFTVQREFLSADEVRELKAAVLLTIDEMKKIQGDSIVAGGGAKIEQSGYYAKVFTQRVNLWLLNDTVKRTLHSPKLGRMVCRLAGVDGTRVWHDQALIKEPFGNPTAWHIDNPYWSFYSRRSISIWIALEDATLENGCMWFIPGTHELASFEPVNIGPNLADMFKTYPRMAEIDPVPVPMKAGDCSFHNGLVAHGAGANMTRQRRMALAGIYMPEGSTFNGQQNILPTDYFKTLREGDELKNDEWNPLIHSEAKTFAKA